MSSTRDFSIIYIFGAKFFISSSVSQFVKNTFKILVDVKFNLDSTGSVLKLMAFLKELVPPTSPLSLIPSVRWS